MSEMENLTEVPMDCSWLSAGYPDGAHHLEGPLFRSAPVQCSVLPLPGAA